jgi:sodium/potassium-transporting ATPase subunit alpha
VLQTYLGAILIIVANINAFIEFYQLQKSQKILESFLNMIPAKCMAVRDGKLSQLEASVLVPGDIVYVRMGDKTPADILVFAASDCKVDNSSLTGESEPQERGPTNDMRAPLEATNLMFNSTLVVSGEAYGIVIRTGDHTVLGQIAHLTAGEEKGKSPLSREIDNFVKIIATIAILTALIFFGIAFPVNNNRVSLALNFAIGIFVAWVPEGLPATVTMLLTIAAKRMASQNVLVKDLQGVETLGAITLLATDKTGTLTRNQMSATNLWTCGVLYEAFSRAGAEKGVASINDAGVEDMLFISALCSRAKFDRTDVPVQDREILGDATES